jgi:hypothetical protein
MLFVALQYKWCNAVKQGVKGARQHFFSPVDELLAFSLCKMPNSPKFGG